jgi:hypothetical protein
MVVLTGMLRQQKISVTSLNMELSVLLVEETEVPRENHRPVFCCLNIPVSTTICVTVLSVLCDFDPCSWRGVLD